MQHCIVWSRFNLAYNAAAALNRLIHSKAWFTYVVRVISGRRGRFRYAQTTLDDRNDKMEIQRGWPQTTDNPNDPGRLDRIEFCPGDTKQPWDDRKTKRNDPKQAHSSFLCYRPQALKLYNRVPRRPVTTANDHMEIAGCIGLFQSPRSWNLKRHHIWKPGLKCTLLWFS